MMMEDDRDGGVVGEWIGGDANGKVRVPDHLEAILDYCRRESHLVIMTRDRDCVSYNRTPKPLILNIH